MKISKLCLTIIFSITLMNDSISETLISNGKYQDSTVVTKDSINHNMRFFVDKNGDGYNDNAPDHDNDGIPNGLDKDYKGRKFRWGRKLIDQDSIMTRGFGRKRFHINRKDSITDSNKIKNRKSK